MTQHDPIVEFNDWLSLAKQEDSIIEPTAMNVATCDKNGRPSNRIVLLKDVDDRGFVFYTNDQGRKGRELIDTPYASLCFWWMPLKRQIRIEGPVEKTSDEDADIYFASRRRESQIGAWASQQSEPLESPEALQQTIAKITTQYEGQDVPRPPHWSGWRVIPERIEFWVEGDYRIHDRWDYTRDASGEWQRQWLNP